MHMRTNIRDSVSVMALLATLLTATVTCITGCGVAGPLEEVPPARLATDVRPAELRGPGRMIPNPR